MKDRSLILILIWATLAVVGAETRPAPEPAPAPGHFPPDGIAARHPGDVGIEKDPIVIFTEDFEEKSLAALWKRWETVSDKPGMSFSADVPPGSAGRHSLIMERERGSGDRKSVV